VSAVADGLSALHGVRTIGIDLVPNGVSVATVTSSTDVDPATVEAAIAEAGYRLAGA
jgi:copper chaperone CopZ